MIQIIADTHTHTLATDHAYSTVTENARAAAEKGLQFLALTEHSPSMPGAPSRLHFGNLNTLPRKLFEVTLLYGIEVNIMDYSGVLDMDDKMLARLEWVIASYHITNIHPNTVKEHTQGWMHIAENSLVDVIGHCGDPRFDFEHRTVIREFAQNKKIVEINAHSFAGRPGSYDNCKDIALLCAEYEVPIVVSSDAHFSEQIGRFDKALELLEEIHFPEQLILNANSQRFLRIAQEKSGKTFIG